MAFEGFGLGFRFYNQGSLNGPLKGFRFRV